MILFFLKAPIALTKTYEMLPDKSVKKTSYPHVFNVTSIAEPCPDMKTFEALITKHAALGHCLLKGTLNRELVNESRAGSTNTMDETDWICLDIDGLPGVTSVDSLLDDMGLNGITYVVQYSASYKVENDNLRCHIYMQVDKHYPAPTLKQWLIAKNLETPVLAAALRLTRTGNTLHWPLDISTCQNDKLLYIAKPVFKGMKDPMPTGRIKYVRKQRAKLSLAGFVPNPALNKEQITRKVNALRVEAGLPKRKETFKIVGTTEYMVKPDIATVTEIKHERGFTYFNLNGGDSWAYYHPDNNPEFIFNFKNEPTYLTKELLPEYWASVVKQQHAQQQAQQQQQVATAHQGAQPTPQGLIRLAFCDRKSSTYFRGYYDPNTDHLELNAARTEKQLRDFAKQHDMPLGDYIPEWTYVFDPHSPTRVDTTQKVINTFQPSPFMRQVPKAVKTCPKVIRKVIHHALGSDPIATERFLNWLAFIIQKKERTRTAWVMHGTTGTGKGLLMNKVLRPLLGESHTTIRRAEEFNEPYNAFMQQTLLVFVDEIENKVMNNSRGVMAKLKVFITEPFISIRRMYSNAYEAPNYSNWIFASNRPDPITIDREDRRINVGTYQAEKLDITEKEIEQLSKELQVFHDYLMSYTVNTTEVHTPLESSDRNNLISINENSADTVSQALLNGDFEFFIDHLPTSDEMPADVRTLNRINDYKQALLTVIGRTQKNRVCAIARDELRSLFEYLVGGMSESPNKFTSYLKHHRLHMDKVWNGYKTVNGIRVTWSEKDVVQFPVWREQLVATSGLRRVV